MVRLRARAAFCALVTCLALPAGVAAQASPTPAPSPVASPANADTGTEVAARAKEWLHRLQTGDIDRTQLDAAMNSALTPDVVKQAAAKFGPLGDPQSFAFVGSQPVGGDGAVAYVYRVVFTSVTLDEVFVVNKDGKIGGIHFPPAQ